MHRKNFPIPSQKVSALTTILAAERTVSNNFGVRGKRAETCTQNYLLQQKLRSK